VAKGSAFASIRRGRLWHRHRHGHQLHSHDGGQRGIIGGNGSFTGALVVGGGSLVFPERLVRA